VGFLAAEQFWQTGQAPVSRTRDSFPKVFNVVALQGAASQVTTYGSSNNTNSSSTALPIARKDERADAVCTDPSTFEVLTPPLCPKKLAYDECALAAGANRKTADTQHVVIKTGEFQRDGISVLMLPNHALGT